MFEGRLAVVTGGTRGIGRATAERLRDGGARVLVTGTKPEGPVPKGCDYRVADFGDEASTEAFAAFLRRHRPLILVNNAGVTNPQPFRDIEAGEFLRVHRINLVAPLVLSRAVLSGMRAARWGRIVNVGSMWGVVSKVGRATYSSSKFGLAGMTAALAAEVAADGILANCVAPGFVETELMTGWSTEEERAALAAQVPMKRLAQPGEIAAFIAWLCSPENSYISGQQLVIDGGYTMV